MPASHEYFGTYTKKHVTCLYEQGVKLARQHDPLGLRTMGVVTKVDKAESGIARKLTATGGSALKLKLGFVAVSYAVCAACIRE